MKFVGTPIKSVGADCYYTLQWGLHRWRELTQVSFFVATKVLSWQTHVCCQNRSFFVTTKVCLLRQNLCQSVTYIFCCNKRSVLSWQKWYLWQLPPLIGLWVLQRSCGREECATSFLILVSSSGIVPSRNVHFWLLWKLCHVDLCKRCVCSFESIPGKNVRFCLFGWLVFLGDHVIWCRQDYPNFACWQSWSSFTLSSSFRSCQFLLPTVCTPISNKVPPHHPVFGQSLSGAPAVVKILWPVTQWCPSCGQDPLASHSVVPQLWSRSFGQSLSGAPAVVKILWPVTQWCPSCGQDPLASHSVVPQLWSGSFSSTSTVLHRVVLG